MDRSLTDRMGDGWEYYISLFYFFILSVLFVYLIRYTVSRKKNFTFFDLIQISLYTVFLSGLFVAAYMFYFRNMSIGKTTLLHVDMPVLFLFAGLTSLWFWKEKQGNKSSYLIHDVNQEMSSLKEKHTSHDRIIEVHHGRNISKIKIEDLLMIYRLNGINYIIDKDNNKYRIDMPLKDFDDLVNSNGYFRANRSLILNREAIISYSQDNRKLILELVTDDIGINNTVGKNKITEFKNWFINKSAT